MNPLLSFWIKVQPLSNSLGSHTWKAIGQSSSLAPSSSDDAVVQRTTSSSAWVFDCFANAAASLTSHMYRASSSWLLNPVISRMHDAPILKPSMRAMCEADRRFTARKMGAGVDAKSLKTTPLQQSQQILQAQDLAEYRIQPPSLVRRNSKEWVREYKKERIDKINYNNVFGGISHTVSNEIPTLSPPAVDSTSYARGGSDSEDSKCYIPHSPTSSSTVPTADSIPSLSPIVKTATAAGSPASNDVICGRGGKANTHPGNISFREEARKLRSWYESSSKSEKFAISSLLVDFVREKGGRFLKRDQGVPGGWLDADGSDVRKKASQALREGRLKEKRQGQRQGQSHQ